MSKVSTHEIPQWTYDVAVKSVLLAKDMADSNEYNLSRPPLVGLKMAHNICIHNFEVLDYYYHRWSEQDTQQHSSEWLKSSREENEQRVSLVQKYAFVMLLSAFEAVARAAVALPGSPVTVNKRYVYLKTVMKKSRPIGLIEDSDYEFWKFSTTLRNSIVHNNAVADTDLDYEFENGYALRMRSGGMTQSSPRLGVLLLDRAITLYARWAQAFEEAVVR